MTKLCKCGDEMEVTIRTLKSKQQLEIRNVPIYTCNSCEQTELLEQVKETVINIIKKHGQKKDKKVVYLDRESELSQLLMIGYFDQRDGINGEDLQQEILDLLDEFLLYDSLDETYWKERIHETIEKIVQ